MPQRDRIAILTPTRGRPDNFSEFVQSVVDRAKNPDRVRVFGYVDSNDMTRIQYQRFAENNRNVTVIVGPQVGVGKAWNKLWEVCPEAAIYGMGNDDLIYVTSGWDDQVVEAIDRFDDRIVCCWFDDGINGAEHCAFPFVSRGWTKAVGAFTPECFQFFRHDTWIYDVAQRVDRTCYIDDVKIEHRHHSKAGGVTDETTRMNRNKGQARKDAMTWETSGGSRESWAKKLRRVMK